MYPAITVDESQVLFTENLEHKPTPHSRAYFQGASPMALVSVPATIS